jgi:signal transduction histidine kinase
MEQSSPPADRTPLEEFMSLVAHEVRTPLALVKMGVESLAALDLRDESQVDVRTQLLAMVERNADLAMLLMDRMSLAREVEEGHIGLSPRALDLVELISASVADLRLTMIDEHTIGLTAPESLVLMADPTALREIMLNLVSNAAKYSAEGAPIEVTVDVDAGTAVVVVRNHGQGVTPGENDSIFEKFFQGDDTAPGVGLGLFISRGLAQAHGGTLTVRPATDSGSEFVLSLPVG